VEVTFSYTQSDSVTGSGTINPFVFNDGGGNINFSATPMPPAIVVNPVPGSTPPGFVGAQTVQSGNSNEGNTLVGLTFSGSALATGTRGFEVFTMEIPLRFVPKVTQVPDVSDYNWNVTYGDSPSDGVDTVSTSMRFAMYMSRDDVVNAAETPSTFQRYTQQNHTFGAGANSFTNTHTSSGAIKDATDAGDPQGTDAAGRDLAFYFGWRDQGALTSGAVLVNEFTIGGLLNTNDASLTRIIPEPGSFGLAVIGVVALAAAFRLRRAHR
jgi:hypothetical protein